MAKISKKSKSKSKEVKVSKIKHEPKLSDYKAKVSEVIILPADEVEKLDKKFDGNIKELNKELRKELKKELKILKNVSPEEYFVLVTGTPLKNIKELIDALDYMDHWVFEHHVNPGRNDFAEWIKWSLKEEELADILHELRTIHETQNAILKYLVRRYL